MIRILLVFTLLLAIFSSTQSQLLFEENFNHPVGDSLRAHGWNITGTVFTNPVSVTSPGLTYTNYPSAGIGNATTLLSSGQDVHDTLASPVTSGTVYASFMLRVTAAQTAGDYFFHLTTTTSPTTAFFARTFARFAMNNNLTFGISKAASAAATPAQYTDSIYSLNTTYLLVVKYAFNSGSSTDDQVSLYVFADPTLPSVEPATPTVGPVSTTQTDATELGLVALRQGTAASAPTIIVDGIRVGLAWANAPLPIQLSHLSARQLHDCIQIRWGTISEINNYGFRIQRSRDRAEIVTIPHSFIPGQGTTNEPHEYSFRDCGASAGIWFYRLKQIDLDGAEHYSDWIHAEMISPTSVSENAPRIFALQQNYPNPFNPETEIRFTVENTAPTTLRVYDLLGQHVATLFDDIAQAGENYSLRFDASLSSNRRTSVASGLYFYRLQSGARMVTKKMMILQ